MRNTIILIPFAIDNLLRFNILLQCFLWAVFTFIEIKLYIINIKSKKLKEYYITTIIFSLMHCLCNFLIESNSFSFFFIAIYKHEKVKTKEKIIK